ncbi:MAG: hypothetical protein ACJA0H_001383 [Francisellaceae bacterium]|jgi:hypothetical protein
MNSVTRTKKSKGVLSLDSAFAIAVIIFLTTYVTAKTEPLASKSNEQLIIDGMTQIIESGENYKTGTTDGYATMTMTVLAAAGYVPASFANTGGSPNGGSYTIGSATTGGYVLASSGNSTELCTRIAAKMNRFLTATCTTGTVSVTIGA